MKKELLIIIPVYNEEGNIRSLIQRMRKEKIQEIGDILVINDGSTDRTKEIVEEEKISLLNKPVNMGYGSTLQLGYKYAARNDYSYVIQIDGDGQHSVSNIKMLYNALRKKQNSARSCPDIVIGSRFLHKENQMHVPWIKKVPINFFRQVIKVVTHQTITDPTSGLQGLNKKAFSFYAGYGNFDYKYPDLNMIMQMLMLGYVIEEVPAKMYSREEGESMHSGIIKPIIYMMIMSLSTFNIILRQRKHYNKIEQHKVNGEMYNV